LGSGKFGSFFSMKNPLYRLKSYFLGLDFAKEKHWVAQFSEEGIWCHKFFFLKGTNRQIETENCFFGVRVSSHSCLLAII
jgi:hypothetical protein